MYMNDKKNYKASIITTNLLAETVYNPEQETTGYAVYKDGQVEFSTTVKIGESEFYPLAASSDIVAKGVILLPSEAAEYGTTIELIADIRAFIHKYLDISPMFEQIAVYYVLFTWLYDRFHELPYLRAIGDFGSGKTRFLQVIGSVSYKPIFTGGATTVSPIFRLLNDLSGTLILDEADFKASDMTAEIVKILNSGYARGFPVMRAEGKGTYEVKTYDVFGPKVVATRETFNDKALESRFLVEEMGRGKLRADVPRRLSDEFYNEARGLRNQLLMWRFRNYHKPLNFDEAPIEGIHPRLHQIIIPLLTIIEDEQMRNDLKLFMQGYNEELIADRGMSWESDVVFAVLKLAHIGHADKVTVKEISEAVNVDLGQDEERLLPRKVGWILRTRLQLKTYKTRKGYVLSLQLNKDKLDFWRERFGITENDLNGVDVHEVNDVNNMTPEEIAASIPF